MSTLNTVVKNTFGLPFYKPKTAACLAFALATGSAMATGGLSLAPAFGQVSAATVGGLYNMTTTAVPYAFSALTEVAPVVWEGVQGAGTEALNAASV